MRNVQKQGARSVGHVRGALAGQPETHVVFGKQHVADAIPVVRFVFANPENFSKREIGQCRVARKLNQALEAECACEIATLFFRANVAPNQRGPNDISFFVE